MRLMVRSELVFGDDAFTVKTTLDVIVLPAKGDTSAFAGRRW